MNVLNEVYRTTVSICIRLFFEGTQVLYVYFNIYLHNITVLWEAITAPDFVFCFFVFQNTCAEAAVL